MAVVYLTAVALYHVNAFEEFYSLEEKMSTRHYLKPNVVFEPLINNWYANEMLLSPAHFALFLVNHHMPVMESFVDAP